MKSSLLSRPPILLLIFAIAIMGIVSMGCESARATSASRIEKTKIAQTATAVPITTNADYRKEVTPTLRTSTPAVAIATRRDPFARSIINAATHVWYPTLKIPDKPDSGRQPVLTAALGFSGTDHSRAREKV